MMDKQVWVQLLQDETKKYLGIGVGGLNEIQTVSLVGWNYEAQSVTYAFPTHEWQLNAKGAIHGGSIAAMFDTALGVVANFAAGPEGASTTDMTVSFLRGVELGMCMEITVFIVKAGRSLIRLRGEMRDAATGKIHATASGSWMPA